jgi:hypothetical protein
MFLEAATLELGWLDADVLRTTEVQAGAWIAAGASGPAPGNYSAVWNAVAMDLWLEHALQG